jgi:hypothetical protein
VDARPCCSEPPPPSPPRSHAATPSSTDGRCHLGAELPSAVAGEQAGFLLSSATLGRTASSLRRAGRDAEPSHHRSRFSCHPHHHILGAIEVLVTGHFLPVVASFVYPKLFPDVLEFITVERHCRLPDTYTGEPPPSFLPCRCATHRAASRVSTSSTLAAALGHCGPLGSASVLCAQAAELLCRWAARSSRPMAFKFFFYFFEYIQIIASSNFCIDLN